MFEIRFGDREEIVLTGRLDASQLGVAEAFFNDVKASATVDLAGLEYISSVGIGLLVSTQQRLAGHGARLRLANAGSMIREVFRFSGLDANFEID